MVHNLSSTKPWCLVDFFAVLFAPLFTVSVIGVFAFYSRFTSLEMGAPRGRLPRQAGLGEVGGGSELMTQTIVYDIKAASVPGGAEARAARRTAISPSKSARVSNERYTDANRR